MGDPLRHPIAIFEMPKPAGAMINRPSARNQTRKGGYQLPVGNRPVRNRPGPGGGPGPGERPGPGKRAAGCRPYSRPYGVLRGLVIAIKNF